MEIIFLARQSGPDVYQFWIAISQIIPVLAISLVIEARALATKEADRQEPRRSRRAIWGVVFWALGFSMLWVELIALSYIALGNPQTWALVVAMIVIAGALGVIFIVPISLITSALWAETVWNIQTHLPWHELQKLRRRALAGLQSAKKREGMLWSHSIEAQKMFADNMATDARMQRVVKLVRERMTQPFDSDPEKDASAREAVEAELAQIEAQPDVDALLRKTRESIDTEIQKTLAQQKVWRKLLHEIEELIKVGATDEQLRALNVRFREVGIG